MKDENMKLQQIQSILECLEEEKKIYAKYLQITENRRLTVEENIQLNMKKKAAENKTLTRIAQYYPSFKKEGS
jgi:ABC-type branched-subunit amino acid transport system ATPase component